MHCLWEGVTKRLISIWMLSGIINPDKANQYILKFRPPSEVTRNPRAVDKYKRWKGSHYLELYLFIAYEFMQFTLFWSLPLLRELGLPPTLIHNWSCFVSVCRVISSKAIPRNCIPLIERKVRHYFPMTSRFSNFLLGCV
jgi:hypothetical protein